MQQSKVLITDDQEIGRQVLGLILEEEGYLLDFASSGLETLEKTKAFLPDLILLDVMMPGMDGLEVCRQLRKDPISAEVPIILVTALDDQKSIVKGFEAGADDFISKPIRRVEIVARVRTITSLNRYRRLMTERAKLDWVIENAEDGYFSINSTGNITYANPKACHYLSIDQKTLPTKESFLDLATKFYSFIPPQNWENWPQNAQSSQEKFLVKPETDLTPAFWLKVDILSLPNELGNILIHLRDVTHKTTLEQSMWKFNTFIQHKMRTPLTLIIGGLEFIQEMGRDLPAEDFVEMSQLTLQGIKRLKDSIEDILSYLSEPLSGKDSKVILSEINPLATDLSKELNLLDPTINIQDNLVNLEIALSKQLFEIILREILENSKKFHPTLSPKIEVTVCSASNNAINIKIKDDGISLTPEQLANIWQPYYQGEKFFTGQTPGMGLGLATVAKAISSVGGAYQIYNCEQTPGLIVELSFPIVRR